jgi:TonB-linked SusC/RagA family outer membrane protein
MKQIRFKVHSICVFLMFLLMIPFGAFAQQGMVTGQVVDEKGESVIGATVQIKGTSDGTITDFDGNFSLKAKVGNTLVVSYVGYSTQEVKISKQTGNRIVLKEDAEVLDEVVVVGYGTARKGDLTGALTTMKPDANDAAKATSLDNLLSGKVAGLVVSSSSAMAGSASSITIRGASSLRGDNQPLYVIDNVPQASAGEFASSGISGDFQINQDPLASLNPSDIEDITILKDASSTAIYGSRGANGVILITTKKGKQGKAKVNVSANFTIAEPSKLLEMTNLYEHAAYINSRVSNGQYPFYVVGDEVRYVFNDALANYDPNNPATYHIINYRNWQKEIYTSAFSQNYSLSVSGGTDKTTYYISANFKDINGTVKQTGLKQGDLRANIGMDLSKSVHLNMTLSGSLRQNNMMAGGSTLGGSTTAISRTALDYAPFEMPDGDPSFSSENKTTIFSWLNDYEDIANDKTFNASMDLSWNIMKGLRYNLRVGGNLNINDRKRWYGLQLYQGMNNNGYLALTDLNKSNVSIENVLNYNTKLGSVATLDATVGVTYDDYNFLNENTNGSQFTMFDLRENGLHMAGNVQHLAPIQKDYQLLSYLGRINLTFLDKYLITASLRADGSSKFGKGNRWGYFPSASVAWRMEQEEFLKEVDWLNQLKVRVSYGVTGNQSIDPYSTFSMYGSDGNYHYGNGNGEQESVLLMMV